MSFYEKRADALALKVLTNAIDAMFPIVTRFGEFVEKYSKTSTKKSLVRDLNEVLDDMRKLVWKMQSMNTTLSYEEHH
jgi:hypothetical protein